jgi:molecular chaperone DnaK (HSP70)
MEIEHMIKKATQLEEEDRALKEKIEVKNPLENYTYTIENSVYDDVQLVCNITDEEKHPLISNR